jgi:hypothetical protein
LFLKPLEMRFIPRIVLGVHNTDMMDAKSNARFQKE